MYTYICMSPLRRTIHSRSPPAPVAPDCSSSCFATISLSLSLYIYIYIYIHTSYYDVC